MKQLIIILFLIASVNSFGQKRGGFKLHGAFVHIHREKNRKPTVIRFNTDGVSTLILTEDFINTHPFEFYSQGDGIHPTAQQYSELVKTFKP